MSNKAIRLGRKALAVAGSIAFVSFVVVVLVINWHHNDSVSKTVPPAPSKSAVATATPNADTRGDDTGVDQSSKYDCRVRMNGDDFAAFRQRLIEFETANLTPPSAKRLETIQKFATEDYIVTQKSFNTLNTHGKTVRLHPDSTIGCFMNEPGKLTAYIAPTVDVIDESSGEVVTSSLVLTTDYTQWIKTKDTWLVSQELR